MSKSVQAMLISDRISCLDSEMIRMLADRLVRDNQQTADALQFALNVAIQEMLVGNQFSKNVTEEAN